jgi:O-antigen ligase
MRKLIFSSIAALVGAALVFGISIAFSAGVLEQPPFLKIGAFVVMIAALVLFLIGIGNIRDGAKQLKAARKNANEFTHEGDNRPG